MGKNKHGNKEAKKPKATPAAPVPVAVAAALPAGRTAADAAKPRKR